MHHHKSPNPEDHLGDVALAHGVCVREAAEQGKSLAHHLQPSVALLFPNGEMNVPHSQAGLPPLQEVALGSPESEN